jgi:hypothetical protein
LLLPLATAGETRAPEAGGDADESGQEQASSRHQNREATVADDRTLDPRMLHTSQPTVSAEERGSSPAARTWQPLVEPGMYVAGVAGDEIGQVKEVRAADFLVDRVGSLGLTPEASLYLPFERIHAMLGDKITLDIPSSAVEEYASAASPYRP